MIGRTLVKAWDDGIFSMSAQAAFWQALSLPPLFLALLGALGYVGGWFGPATVEIVEGKIVEFSRQVFTPEVVDQIIAPTAASILTIGRADVVSIGFVISLWAGSSAISSLVDSITEAHGQYDVRHPVWQRVFSLLIYLFALVVAVFTLPIVALGPDLLPEVLPESWRPTATSIIDAFYYPGAGLILVLVLTTLYKLALPHSLPWRRLLPGALLAMLVFIVSTTGLRVYIAVITTTGYTYGALATPIAFLLFAFLLGFSIVLGAQLNNAVEQVWPARPTRRQRRLHRMLSMRRIAARRAAQVLWPAGAGGAGSTAGPGAGSTAPECDRVTPDLPVNGRSAHAGAGPPSRAKEST
ncbi:YihY/virulence factor BrkB family protein [Pseudonocardia sp. H11422]|uniref:YihY/virulence factor BrkB family protein n=1 Tax=Pseudonocardia sp. H11422 TaxID=2835866 RepID=UPI0027E33739|nr:YihY/virulence factor BrkB family protein [Pseudonocardia sp. H11422]